MERPIIWTLFINALIDMLFMGSVVVLGAIVTWIIGIWDKTQAVSTLYVLLNF